MLVRNIEKKIKRLEAKLGEIKPTMCSHCDFGLGRRGMDRCGRCKGTGSGFRVGLKFFPNTEQGYLEALQCHLQQASQ